MNKVFRLFVLFSFITFGLSAQQAYKKEIEDVKTDLVKTLATSEGGFLVYNTFPKDTILFQLIKYDTCGLIEWSKQYSDTLADSTARPIIILDESDNGRILYLQHANDLSDIILFQIDDKGTISTQSKITTGILIETLDNIVFDEVNGLFVTAHTINKNEQLTYLFNLDISNNTTWVHRSPDQYYGLSIFEDTLLLSSFQDEMDSTVHIESININGTHQWRKELINFNSITNIIENNGEYNFVGQLHSGVKDSVDYALVKMDLQGEIISTSDFFGSNGNGILLQNERGPLYMHYDSVSIASPTENLSFIQFFPNGDMDKQYYFNDIEDTLSHGSIAATILADNVSMSLCNYATVDSTHFLVIGKVSAAANFSFGMGCVTEEYTRLDTSITVTSDSQGLSIINTLAWVDSQEEHVKERNLLIEDEIICEMNPMTSTTPSAHCIGEIVEFFDKRTGEILTITSKTTVIEDQYMLCGELITKSIEFTFSAVTSALPIPKAFTPNGDRMNDRFGVVTDTMNILDLTFFDMRIYNRWGEKVFETTYVNEGWDGNHDGEPAIADIYIYYIAYKGKLGSCDIDEVFKGDVTLIR